MLTPEQFRELCFDYLYDLLEETQVRQVEEYLAANPEARAELERSRNLMASAARQEFPGVRFIPPTIAPAAANTGRPDRSPVAPLARGVQSRRNRGPLRWALAGSALLVVVAVGAPLTRYAIQYSSAREVYLDAEQALAQATRERTDLIEDHAKATADADEKIRQAQDKISSEILQRNKNLEEAKSDVEAKQLLLTVTGPAAVQPGAPNDFTIVTNSKTGGNSIAARLNIRFVNEQNETLFEEKDIQSQGQYALRVPPDLPYKPGVQLAMDITASSEGKVRAELNERLPWATPRYVTHLMTDKPIYQPGQTIFFRSETLLRSTLNPPLEDLHVVYTLTKPDGLQVFQSQGSTRLLVLGKDGQGQPLLGPDGKPVRGIGAGEFNIPDSFADGDLTLTVREAENRFPEEKKKVAVKKLLALQNAGAPEPLRIPAAPAPKNLAVRFYPEGGDLVAGLTNRVYFKATTPTGKPADMRGRLLDSEGREIARLETLRDDREPGVNQGLGVFTFTPKVGQSHILKIDEPWGIDQAIPMLPDKSIINADGIAMSVPTGVTGSDEPIRVELQSAGKARNVLVGAYCRGRLLDHQRVVVESGKTAVVELKPAESPGGVVRVTVFEEEDGPESHRNFKPRAERLVFRKPAKAVKFEVVPDKSSYAPGERVSLSLAATDERGKPASAMAIVSVIDQSVLATANDKSARTLPTHFFLAGEVHGAAELEYADFLLSDHPKAASVLDLLLGVQGWRRFAEQNPEEFRKRNENSPERAEEAERILVWSGQAGKRVFDSLVDKQHEIEANYEVAMKDLEDQLKVAIDQSVTLKNGEAYPKMLESKAREIDDKNSASVAATAALSRLDDKYRANLRMATPIIAGIAILAAIGFAAAAMLRGIARSAKYHVAAVASLLAGVLLLLAFSLTGERSIVHAGKEMAIRNEELGAAAPALVQKPSLQESLSDPAKIAPDGKAESPHNAPAQERPMEEPKPAPRGMGPGGGGGMGGGGMGGGRGGVGGSLRGTPIAPGGRAKDERPTPSAPAATAPAPPAMRSAEMPPARDEAKSTPRAQPDSMAKKGDRPEAMKKPIAERRSAMPEFRRSASIPAKAANAATLGFKSAGAVPAKQLARSAKPFIVREYAFVEQVSVDHRDEYAETVFWHPAIVIDESGKKTISFQLGEAVTRYRVLVAGHTLDGRLGEATLLMEANVSTSPETKALPGPSK